MAETPETVEVNVVMGAQLRAIVRSALIHVKNKIKDALPGAGFPGSLDSVIGQEVTKLIDEELGKWPLAVAPDQPDTLGAWLYDRFGRYMTDGISPTPVWDDLVEEDVLYWNHQAAAVRRAVGRGGFKTAIRDRMNLVLSTPINELHQVAKEAHEGGGEIKGLRPLDLKHTESLGEAIRITVGAASTCWTNLIGAGVFKSEDALDIATQLEHHFFALLQVGRKQMFDRHQALGEMLQDYLGTGQPLVSTQQVYNVLCGQSTPAEYGSALQERANEAGPRTPGFDGPEGETAGWKAKGPKTRDDNPYVDGV